jgi:integrase
MQYQQLMIPRPHCHRPAHHLNLNLSLQTNDNDISLEGQLIRIYESEKTGTGRVVYFGNDAAQALYQWLMKRDYWKKHLFHGPRDKAISYEAARAIFKKYESRLVT